MRDNELIQHLFAGAQTASALGARANISQPTLSRRIAAAGDAIVRIGNARQTRYALTRPLAGQRQFAVYRINQQAKIEPLGSITPVHSEGYVLNMQSENTANNSVYSQSLPWWLTDCRPQGFIGRSFVHQWASKLGLPDALNLWSDDHVLIALSQYGLDCSGNLMIGDAALNAYLNQAPTPLIAIASRLAAYTTLAQTASAGELVGSSAGGEQPKFNAHIQGEHAPYSALIKFSSPQNNAATRRWRDLLIAEHLALTTLNTAGVCCAQSELLETPTQTFLETRRFDRIFNQNGHIGRLGVVSLGALDDEFTGLALAWPQITQALAQQKIISANAHQTAASVHAFGQLIANTDMHRGNLSLMHTGNLPLEIAPIYDMLPMHYAPRSSGMIPNQAPTFTIHHADSLPHLRNMLPLAQTYWQTVATDGRISDDFKTIATLQIELINSLKTKMG